MSESILKRPVPIERSYNLNSILGEFVISYWDQAATGSPQEQGVTYSGTGVILTCASTAYGIQIALQQADGIFVRTKGGAGWSTWKRIQTA